MINPANLEINNYNIVKLTPIYDRKMLQVNYKKWEESPPHLRSLGLNSDHPRTRERFLALHDIIEGKNATQIARETGRNHHTVISWVHKYNEFGSESLFYQRSGGRRPLFAKKLLQA